MDQKARAKRRSKKYLLVGTSIAAGLMLGTAPITIATPLFTIGSQQVYADLVSGQLFNNLGTTNTSGTSVGAPYVVDGSTRNVDFVISANNGLDVSLLTGTRRAVLAIPEEMQGLVAINGSGTFSMDILLPGDELAPLLTVVNGAVSALVGSVENIVNLNPLASVNLSEVYEQLALLENLSTLSSAEVALALQQTENGDYIYGELDGTLEIVIREGLSEILTGINNAVQELEATSNSPFGGDLAAATINGALGLTIKPAFNLAFAGALGLVDTGSSLIGTFADASVLGETTVTIPTTITDPNATDLTAAGVDLSVPYEAGFVGNIVKSDVLAIDIASNYDGYSPVYYSVRAVTAPYNVSVTGNSTEGYEVTGMADPNAIVRIYDDTGNLIAEGQADETGSFTISISQEDVAPLDEIQLIAYDNNDNPSLPTVAVIPDDEEADADADADADAGC